jgi:carbamoyltransferase
MKKEPWIMGISLSHNGAICLLKGSEIVVAIQEERLSRKKRDFIYGAQPARALNYCLDYAGIGLADLSVIIISASGPKDANIHDLTKNNLLGPLMGKKPIIWIPHHLGHAVAAFATSGFDEAAVLVIDGAGSPYSDLDDWEKQACKTKKLTGPLESHFETISMYFITHESIACVEKHLGSWILEDKTRMSRFRSLGGMYAAVSGQIFGNVGEAGKVMGLAPYGIPDTPASDFFTLIDGEFIYYDKLPDSYLHSEHWPLRRREYENLSASVQRALEDAVHYLVGHFYDKCPKRNLCYAGGVALNSVMNERIIRESNFENVFIMPAAEDSGVAVGAAYYGLWKLAGKNLSRKLIHDSVGKKYFSTDISAVQDEMPTVSQVKSYDLIDDVVNLLCEGKIIGWFQGGSELGPRALGQRSILCDPRMPDGKQVLNGKVKHRESFRPFAPAILLEEVNDWFDMGKRNTESPFMLRVCAFREDKIDQVPAVVHVDGTGRVQTVTREGNGLFYQLVRRFYEKTGVPIILNTSFNTMDEPIVETPEDALLCFQSTGIDFCVIGDRLFTKRSAILFDNIQMSVHERLRQQTAKLLDFSQINGDNSTGHDRALTDRLLDDYVGSYENPVLGVVKVARNGSGLKGYIGGVIQFEMSYLNDSIYKTGSGPYLGYMIVFLRNRNNIVDCVAAVSQYKTYRQYYFSRASENVSPKWDYLAQLTGNFRDGSRALTVSQRNNRLFAGVPQQQDYELVFCKEDIYCLRGVPGYGIEFIRNQKRDVIAATAIHPEISVELRLDKF